MKPRAHVATFAPIGPAPLVWDTGRWDEAAWD